MTADSRIVKGIPPQPERREFFVTGCVALVTATFGFMASTFRFLVPNVFYEPSRRFTVGRPEDFPQGAATFLPDRRLFVFNSADGFYAISSICTHLGCNVKKGPAGFTGPCHGSKYDDNGQVTRGPAPLSLSWYAVSQTPRGELLVDMERTVKPDFRFRV